MQVHHTSRASDRALREDFLMVILTRRRTAGLPLGWRDGADE